MGARRHALPAPDPAQKAILRMNNPELPELRSEFCCTATNGAILFHDRRTFFSVWKAGKK
jgi:hypothetical protein